MDLSDEQKRIDTHAFVVAQFDGDYSEAVRYLSALAVLNKHAHDAKPQIWSLTQGKYIDYHPEG